ncbi:MAG: PEP/pyruvate-binding domain-containing protein, partial [Minisyncoccia bacterium]
MYKYIKFFNDITLEDIPKVGGKNASLGEMYKYLAPKGVNLPNGFATTAKAYSHYINDTGLKQKIEKILGGLDVTNMRQLRTKGAQIRALFMKTPLPSDLEEEIRLGYYKLGRACGQKNLVVAIRSSATAEDLPNASFAGQQETYLNIQGIENVLRATQQCIASLFTDRAIVYRVENGFEHMNVALSVGIQQMVARHSYAAGVMFTIDTETGF